MTVVSTNPEHGNELRERRQQLGISQQKLAAAADCSLSSIRLYEAGYDPVRSTLRRLIEDALDELEIEAGAA